MVKFTSLIKKGSIKGPSPYKSRYFIKKVSDAPTLREAQVQTSPGTKPRVVYYSSGGGGGVAPFPKPVSLTPDKTIKTSVASQEPATSPSTPTTRVNDNQQVGLQGQTRVTEQQLKDVRKGIDTAKTNITRLSDPYGSDIQRFNTRIKSYEDSIKNYDFATGNPTKRKALDDEYNYLVSEQQRLEDVRKNIYSEYGTAQFLSSFYDPVAKEYYESKQDTIANLNRGIGSSYDLPLKPSPMRPLEFKPMPIKTPDPTIDITGTKLPGMSNDIVGTIFARSFIPAKEARNRNIFRIGVPIIDDISSNFAAGAQFTGSILAETGGQIGQLSVIGSFKQDIVAKQKVEAFFNTNYSSSFAKTIAKKQLELEIMTLGGSQSRTQNIETISKTDLNQYLFIKPTKYQSALGKGEQTGRIIGESLPYLNPTTGLTKALIDVGSSRTQEQLITNVATGFLFGAGTKIFTSTGKLIPLKLNKLFGGTANLTKKGLMFSTPVAGLSSKAIIATDKYLLPGVGVASLAISGGQSIYAASVGSYDTAKQIEKDLFSSLGGMRIGGIAGDVIGLQLQRPIQKRILFETGSQSFRGIKRKEFLEQFDYVYNVLPRKQTSVKKLRVNELEILQALPKRIAGKVSRVTEKTLGEFEAEIIGSAVIVPQTRLTKTPKGKIGDIDVAKGSKALADTLALRVSRVLPKSYSAKVYKKDFQGTDKFMVSILKNGQRLAQGTNLLEFVNVGTSLQPTSRQFDLFEGIGSVPSVSFKTTKSGAKILNISSQAKAKLYGGYFGSRAKDIIDLKGIIAGTKNFPKVNQGIKLPSAKSVFGGLKSMFKSPGISFSGLGKKSFGSVSGYDYVSSGYGGVYGDVKTNYYQPVKYSNYVLAKSNYYQPFKYSKTSYAKPSYTYPKLKMSRYDYSKMSYLSPQNYKTSYVLPKIAQYPTTYKPPYAPPLKQRTPYTTPLPHNQPREFKTQTFKQSKSTISSANNQTKVYDTFVRRNNNTKWIKVAEKNPRNRAYNKGFFEADNTIGQSVKIKTSGKQQGLIDDPFLNNQKFSPKKRGSKIPNNPVFIEQRQFAIDTIGEKQGLKIKRYKKQRGLTWDY